MNAQLAGLILATIGAVLLWSVWAFVIAGAVLVIVPELVEAVRK